MMKKLFHPITFCLLFWNSLIFSQTWFSDPSFLTYYSQENENVLTPNFSEVRIHLSSNSNTTVKHLSKAKGFVNFDDTKKILTLDLSPEQNSAFTNISIEKIADALNIKPTQIKEIVPKVKVNGQIDAELKSDFIVKFNSSVNEYFMDEILNNHNAKIIGTKPDGAKIFHTEKIKEGFDLMHQLSGMGLIEYAQPDMIVKVEHTDDPLFSKQYQIQNSGQYIDGQKTVSGIDLNVTPAWKITKGAGITVAIVDDGLENHEDLPQIKAGYTPANEGNGSPNTTGKHGMAVSGIIAAQHNEIGIKGISPEVSLLSINIFEQGTSISDYAQSFYWAVDNGADIINNSWGFLYEDVEIESTTPPTYTVRKGAMCSKNPFPALTSAINFAADHGRNGKGCIITFASGNWAQEGPLGQNSDECVTYPASLEKVIAIGALNPQGKKSIYSDYGPKLDFVAPSNDINSSGSRSYFGVRTIDREGSEGYSKTNYYSGFGGTSAATPAASGAIALILSAHPSLTRKDLTEILKSTAKDVESVGFDNLTGYGLIDAEAAIKASMDPESIEPCYNKNGDSDNDGICDADDCAPQNSFYPAKKGTPCNDNDPSTSNDVVTEDGCGCEGVPLACYASGGDHDGDGYCYIDDCDDNNPFVPAATGTPCDDNDTLTENDQIQDDNCTCKGEVVQIEEEDDDDAHDEDTDEENGEPECNTPTNLAPFGKVNQSSTFFTFSADRANDGNLDNSRYAQTNYSDNPYIDLALNSSSELQKLNIILKATPRSTVHIFISNSELKGRSFNDIKEDESVTYLGMNEVEKSFDINQTAKHVRLQMQRYQSLAVVEIEAFGCSNEPQVNGLDSFGPPNQKEIGHENLEIKTYPNPTTDHAYIEFKNALGRSGELFIYNSLGKKIYQKKMSQLPLIPIHINLQNYRNGMYFIELVSENQRFTEKIIVGK